MFENKWTREIERLKTEAVSKDLMIETMGKELESYETIMCIKISKWGFVIFCVIVICFIIAYKVWGTT
jgi:hypothetical protein